MAVEYLPIGWSQYHTLARKLAATVLDRAPKIDKIVAISRGGLTLGHLLTDFLRVPISTITIQSYHDIQTQGRVTITDKLKTPIRNQHVLLVDDVSDTGKTLVRAVRYLKNFGPKHITTVTMFYKPQSVFRPDYYAQKTSKWILFPYEPTEMILLITKQMQTEGKSKAEIQEFLERLDYADDEIAFVRRHHLP